MKRGRANPGSHAMTRRALLAAAGAAAALGTRDNRRARASEASPPSPDGRKPMVGVNLAGAEFGERFPGTRGVDYIYPTDADFDYAATLGLKLIRMPFAWERLQPRPDGPLDEAEWSEIERAIGAAQSRGMALWLDNHGYGARRRMTPDGVVEDRIGTPRAPASGFARFSAMVCERLADHPSVLYGVMNEPAELEAVDWLHTLDLTLREIRAANSATWLVVAGVAWSGAHSWLRVGNTALARLSDPAGRMLIDVHQYLDGDSSGTTPEAVSPRVGSRRIAAFEQWARDTGVRALLGEFGSGRDPVSLAAIEDLLLALEASPDVWAGWCGWAAGPWWPDDDRFRLSADPDGAAPPQMALIAASAARVAAR